MNLVVTTTVNQYNVNLRFIGPIDRLRTSYSSNPPLPPVDIINMLVTGRPTEAASANPTTPQSVLAGQLAGQVSSRVEKLAGFSSLTIDPQIGGTGSNPGARLALQQRVTKKLFFTFATDVTSTQDALVQVEYHEFADQSIRYSAWARAFYDLQRSRGKDHHAAPRSLAYKWVRIIFRCWKAQKPYDEEVYLESPRRRGSSLLEKLP